MLNVAVMGGGPAGLYFGISLKLKNPLANITIIERNKATDTFGWGVYYQMKPLVILKIMIQ